MSNAPVVNTLSGPVQALTAMNVASSMDVLPVVQTKSGPTQALPILLVDSAGNPSGGGGGEIPADLMARLESVEVEAQDAAILAAEANQSASSLSVAVDQHTSSINAIDGELLTRATLVDGKVPYEELPDFPVGRKIAVVNEAERLGLSVYSDLTIAYEEDTADAWALNPDADPAVAANWSKLGNAQAIGVTSFNGRTGGIDPQVGDYTTEQVTESATKRYVTTSQVNKWDAASDSGSNYVTKSRIGQALGVAGLDENGKVYITNLPNFLPQSARIWRDVKANRTVGTWYTNTSKNEMVVHIRSNLGSAANRFISMGVRQNAGATSFIFNNTVLNPISSGIGYADSNTVTIPSGWQYTLSSNGGSTDALTERWYELS